LINQGGDDWPISKCWKMGSSLPKHSQNIKMDVRFKVNIYDKGYTEVGEKNNGYVVIKNMSTNWKGEIFKIFRYLKL
jgi:hypothetical protein